MIDPPRGPAVTPLPVPAAVGRIVLLGGTFDPPHRAHTELGSRARDLVAGAEAWLVFVPASRSPFKSGAPTSDGDRLEMLRRAAATVPHSCIWTDEIERARGGEPSYWIDTLRRLRTLRGGGAVWFIVGADQAAELHRWRGPREILALARPIVLPREPVATAADLEACLRDSGAWTDEEIADLTGALVPIGLAPGSATEVRDFVRTKGPDAPEVRALLAPGVIEFIRARRLYATTAPQRKENPA